MEGTAAGEALVLGRGKAVKQRYHTDMMRLKIGIGQVTGTVRHNHKFTHTDPLLPVRFTGSIAVAAAVYTLRAAFASGI